MMRICSIALSIWILALANSALSEVPRSVIDKAQAEAFPGSRRATWLLYSVQTTGSSWELVSVFSQPFDANPFSSDAPKRWVLRRHSGRGETFSPFVRWADSATCPQIEGVLWSLSRLVVPSFEVPGISHRRPALGVPDLALPADGAAFSIWGQGIQPDGAPAFVSLSGLGGELTQWGVHAERELAACWSEQPLAE